MDESKQPGIRFENVLLHKLTFSRVPKVIERPDLAVELASRANVNDDKTRLVIELDASVKDVKGKSFEVACTMIGFFSVVPGAENFSIEDFAKVNAIALMLPYVREVIANTTLRAGIKPVILPPLNVKSVVTQAAQVN